MWKQHRNVENFSQFCRIYDLRLCSYVYLLHTMHNSLALEITQLIRKSPPLTEAKAYFLSETLCPVPHELNSFPILNFMSNALLYYHAILEVLRRKNFLSISCLFRACYVSRLSHMVHSVILSFQYYLVQDTWMMAGFSSRRLTCW
jgi:hypothetical protein